MDDSGATGNTKIADSLSDANNTIFMNESIQINISIQTNTHLGYTFI